MKGNLIFVYGTLRHGFGNNRFLLGKAEFCGEATTKEKFALYAAGIPYLNKEQKVSRIKGELYLVSDEELTRIDALEGHPNWYKREPVDVEQEECDGVTKAWVYFNPNTKGDLVESGDFVEYAGNR